MFVSYHRTLPVEHLKTARGSLTAIGFIIDPGDPTADTRLVLQRLMNEADTALSLLSGVYALGGRYVLIYCSDKERIALSDATGLRSVSFARDEDRAVWLASQPGLLANVLQLEADPVAYNEFVSRPEIARMPEWWWPNDECGYVGLKRLLPNHYLDLETGSSVRFWPSYPIARLSLEAAAQRVADLLVKLIEGATCRFALALPLTAGWDSRTLLAASRQVSRFPAVWTALYYSLRESSPDVAVPQGLAKRFGFQHTVFDCRGEMTKEFREFYLNNVKWAHPALGNIVWGLLQTYPCGMVCMKGNASEIGRCVYRLGKGQALTGSALARAAKMSNNQFAARHFQEWLDAARPVAERCGLNILDLFHWENRMGSWQAQSQLEFDITHETFTPYNSREILQTMLSTAESDREPPQYALHRKLIEILWPELLTEAINPGAIRKAKEVAKRVPAVAGLVGWARRAYDLASGCIP